MRRMSIYKYKNGTSLRASAGETCCIGVGILGSPALVALLSISRLYENKIPKELISLLGHSIDLHLTQFRRLFVEKHKWIDNQMVRIDRHKNFSLAFDQMLILLAIVIVPRDLCSMSGPSWPCQHQNAIWHQRYSWRTSHRHCCVSSLEVRVLADKYQSWFDQDLAYLWPLPRTAWV